MEEDPPRQKPISQDAYFDNAIRAVKQKKPAPEIDFTLHTMDDNTQVSTVDRVCKGMFESPSYCHLCLLLSYHPT
jgi:serine/threonine-protein phosphatase 2B catalytic subunit